MSVKMPGYISKHLLISPETFAILQKEANDKCDGNLNLLIRMILNNHCKKKKST